MRQLLLITPLLTLAGILGVGGVAHAQTFTADLVVIKPGGQTRAPLGRVAVSEGRIRLDTRDLADGFFIVDTNRPSALFVRPAQHVYMDARRSSRLTQVFVPVDPDDACRRWRAMERVAGPSLMPVSPGSDDWQCERLGVDVIDGRETVKYRTVSPQGQPSDRWIDPVRRFPIRLATPDGATVIVESIVDGPQPPSLFDVPGGFEKFDPLELLDRIKQSDVWVDPPPAPKKRQP
jgi:hypothetical protein